MADRVPGIIFHLIGRARPRHTTGLSARIRIRPALRIHRMRRILLALAALLAATPAAAQHCWPSTIALIVRDASGAVIDPAALDSIRHTPRRSRDAGDFGVGRTTIDTLSDQSFARGPTPVLAFYGQGACRVTMREVVLRKGGETMRLWMDLRVDTQEHPGPSNFAVNTPAFASGTWRLDVCGLPAGKSGKFAMIEPRWTPVPEPEATEWQPSHGCEDGTRP